jgi:hypothetical protein
VSRENPKPKAAAGNGGGSPAPKRDAPVMNNNTGRVKFDDRGNAIWEWAVSTGSFGTEVSTSRLKKLENQTLSLADDSPTPAPATTVKQNPKGVAHGYSPYDSGVLVKAQPPRKKDLKRLSEWLQLRKQASNNKTDKE